MRPGNLVAAGCFALLSLFRLTDGAPGWAAVFAVAAVLNVALAFREPPAVRRPRSGAADGVGGAKPTPQQLRQNLELQRTHAKTWLAIVVGGWVAAVGGLFVFLPMSLVLAGLAMIASFRYRRCRQSIAVLQRALAVS